MPKASTSYARYRLDASAKPKCIDEVGGVAEDLFDLAERTVASVTARRSTWTVWNVRAEVERMLRAKVPFLPPERHRELADAVTALAVSPAHSLSVEAPALLDEPAELRRARVSSTPSRGCSTRPGRRLLGATS